MTNAEKKEWILDQINRALLASMLSGYTEEYVTFSCPWGSRYRVVADSEHLTRFQKKVSKCYGFRNHGKRIPNWEGIK